MDSGNGHSPRVRVAIVGAGFGGLGAAIRLKQRGIDDFVVLEREDAVGGTWCVNTYPGCQCDIPSNLYSFSFAPNPSWSRTFPTQPEIWDYLRECTERYGITPHLRLGTEVTGADWDDEAAVWRIETSRGPLAADVVIAAPGGLSAPAVPDLPGLERFEGPAFHTARWDHDVDLRGKRVAVVGTGASAIQVVPRVQPEVERLHVFQRTPPWIMPHPDRPVSPRERWLFRRFPALQRLARGAIYWALEMRGIGFTVDPRVLKLAERIADRHRRKQVPDPELRRKLTPEYRMGCKRVLLSDDYYSALTRPNVDLVTDGIAEVRAHSVVTADGTEREVDAIVFGTGFKVHDHPMFELVRGRDRTSMAEAWQGSPQAYLGTSVAGFPNLFLLVGPNTGLGHNSIVFIIESQLRYVLGALDSMDRRDAATVEVRPDVQEEFNAELQDRSRGTVWTEGGCSSWYLDRNGRNATLWPGFSWSFHRATRHFDPESYVFGGIGWLARNRPPGSTSERIAPSRA
jgi:cation diffusion facilitator CzcD-associated flavoprotein CzcO